MKMPPLTVTIVIVVVVAVASVAAGYRLYEISHVRQAAHCGSRFYLCNITNYYY